MAHNGIFMVCHTYLPYHGRRVALFYSAPIPKIDSTPTKRKILR